MGIYFGGQLQKQRTSSTPLTLNFSDLHAIFRKETADCGDKVGNCTLFRKLNKRALEKFRGGKVWASAVAVAAAAAQETIG